MAAKKNTAKSRGANKNQKAAPRKPESAKNTRTAEEKSSNALAKDKIDQNLPAVEVDPGDLPAVEENPQDLPAVETNPGDLPAVEDNPQDLPAVETNPGDLPAVEDNPEDLPTVETNPGDLPAVEENPEDLPAVEPDPGDLPAVENPETEAPKAQTTPSHKSSSRPDVGKAGCTPIPPVGKISPRLPGGIEKRPLFSGNPYLPRIVRVVEAITETPNIKTLRVIFDDEKEMENFFFEPGQVGQLSVFGAGEATFVINSPPSERSYLQFSIMRVGEVTDALHKVKPGDKIGLRGPLGNFFPYKNWQGKNVFFIGGGIGMAPIRTIMLTLLENSADYGKLSLLYGARSPKDMAYSYELESWRENPHLDCTFCIDNPYEGWGHRVGLIPKVLEELAPAAENTVAVLCGPPIMIKFTLQALLKLGFEPENIITTLEMRMKCGIGQCGRCNIGDRYVCVDGPVFSLAELDGLPYDG